MVVALPERRCCRRRTFGLRQAVAEVRKRFNKILVTAGSSFTKRMTSWLSPRGTGLTMSTLRCGASWECLARDRWSALSQRDQDGR